MNNKEKKKKKKEEEEEGSGKMINRLTAKHSVFLIIMLLIVGNCC